MYRDNVCTIVVFRCSAVAVARVLLYVQSVLVIRTTQSDPFIHDVFLLEIHCRKVSNAERVNWNGRSESI